MRRHHFLTKHDAFRKVSFLCIVRLFLNVSLFEKQSERKQYECRKCGSHRAEDLGSETWIAESGDVCRMVRACSFTPMDWTLVRDQQVVPRHGPVPSWAINALGPTFERSRFSFCRDNSSRLDLLPALNVDYDSLWALTTR